MSAYLDIHGTKNVICAYYGPGTMVRVQVLSNVKEHTVWWSKIGVGVTKEKSHIWKPMTISLRVMYGARGGLQKAAGLGITTPSLART